MATADRSRSSVTVRTRITATVALLVLAGLVLAGVVVQTIESTRLDRQLADATAQEFAQFRKLQEGGVDPTTGDPFPDVESMVRLYLQRTVPDDDELLVGWWDDAARVQSPAWDEVSGSTVLADAVRRLLPTNGTERVDSPYGELEVSVQGVRQGGRTGALVVVRLRQAQALRVRAPRRDDARERSGRQGQTGLHGRVAARSVRGRTTGECSPTDRQNPPRPSREKSRSATTRHITRPRRQNAPRTP